MANIAVKIELTDEERKEFESLGRNRKTARALARRARGGGRADQQANCSETEDDRGDGGQAAPPLCGAPAAFATNLVRVGCGVTTTLPT